MKRCISWKLHSIADSSLASITLPTIFHLYAARFEPQCHTIAHVLSLYILLARLASFCCPQEFVDAVGRPFIDGGHLTDDTVGYIVSGATVHINRHVREASFQIIR